MVEAVDKNSLNMFKQVMGALSHTTELDEEHLKTITLELKRIQAKLPVKPREGCNGCGKKKKEFLKLQNEIHKNTEVVS